MNAKCEMSQPARHPTNRDLNLTIYPDPPLTRNGKEEVLDCHAHSHCFSDQTHPEKAYSVNAGFGRRESRQTTPSRFETKRQENQRWTMGFMHFAESLSAVEPPSTQHCWLCSVRVNRPLCMKRIAQVARSTCFTRLTCRRTCLSN